jgi:beta-galactosidase
MSRPTNYPPVNPRFPFLWHGGDYNPDQWLHVPGTLDEDFRLFPLAGVNSVSVAIFGWAALEPEEGRYEFGWLDDVMDRCAQQGMAVVLATPSGAKPNWMAAKYPEIRRMAQPANGLEPVRNTQHTRHNHCPSSPVYREKCVQLNTQLAERYAKHPALALWHVSNEYGGPQCHCPLCFAAFRDWLRAKYTSLDRLNQAWWTGFWSHAFTEWDQITTIDGSVEGMALDWKRFVTDQTVDFFRTESAPLRSITPDVPVTVNLMGFYEGLDYWRFAPYMDVASWDNYPAYHDRSGQTEATASHVAMSHDLNRSLKGGKPFLLMESSPGPTNWMPINRLLRPGVHRLKSLQAIAHGSDSVQYFQIRKGRGGCEKFHGAVIDHVGHEHTRMFAEVAQVGADLKALTPVVGASTPAKVGLIVDWEARWALAMSAGPSTAAKDYMGACHAHYRPYWKRGVAVDILNGDSPLDGYDVVLAPSLYLLREGFGARVEAFVERGGTFIATYLTGIADEAGLVFAGGWPGPLRKVLGVWAEEIDYLYDDERNGVTFAAGNALGLCGSHAVTQVCDVIHAETAETAAVYDRDFYARRPAITVNRFGRGEAWYVAAKGGHDLLDAFHGALIARRGLPRALEADLPEGVVAQTRTNGRETFTFVTNFASEAREVQLGPVRRKDLLTGAAVSGTVTLPPYGVQVLGSP